MRPATIVPVDPTWEYDRAIDAAIGKNRLSNIRIVPAGGRVPAPGIVNSLEDVARIRLAVREALASLATARPNVQLIHLFVAAPVSVCLAIGQELRLRNGKDVQTYRYRTGTSERALTRAIVLTSGDVNEARKPLSLEDKSLAARLRPVWQAALVEVREHARSMKVSGNGVRSRWYDELQPSEPLRESAPFPGLRPMHELIQDKDSVSTISYPGEFRLDSENLAI